MAEPRDAQRPELVLEGGMNAVKMDMVVGAGAHFKKIGWVDEVSSSEEVRCVETGDVLRLLPPKLARGADGFIFWPLVRNS